MGARCNATDTVVGAMVTGVKYKLMVCEVDELEALDVITSDYMKCISDTVNKLASMFESLKKQLDELDRSP